MRQLDWIDRAQATTALDRHLWALFWRIHDPSDIRRAWAWREALSFRDAWYVALRLTPLVEGNLLYLGVQQVSFDHGTARDAWLPKDFMAMARPVSLVKAVGALLT